MPVQKPRRVARLLPLCCALVLALSACAAQQVLFSAPDGTRITLLQNQRPPANAIDPAFQSITPLTVEASLRRITITHATWISLAQSDPKPLLSPEQVRELRGPLAERLARLNPGERLQVAIKDPYKGYDVEIIVYADGGELVYVFTVLMQDPDRPQQDMAPVDQGHLVAQPGQTVTAASTGSMLRESIKPDELARAEIAGRVKARIEKAYTENALTVDERERLLAIAAGTQSPPEDAWKLFWERWDLLRKAHDQELVDNAAFAQRKSGLLAELQH